MKRIDDSQWAQVSAAVKTSCPRVSVQDLSECEQRIDLLIAKIQNRHWISRTAAQGLAFVMLKDAEAASQGNA